MKFSAPRGTRDLLPEEARRFLHLESVFWRVASTFGFEPIRVPTFEATELFARGVGDATDIVTKEMYTFLDRSQRSLTLRPEGTAGVIRAFVEHGLSQWLLPVKLAYALNVFRYEKVQKGRYREFWQLGVESLGATSYEADVEIIVLLDRYVRALGLTTLRLDINTIGCPVCRPAYLNALRAYFAPRLEAMCDDCHTRFATNVLRMIDCKVDACRPHIDGAPLQQDYLCPACREHHERVLSTLDDLGIAYQSNGRMVRGLDYYTKTVFEFVSEHVGTQGTICGGGRYEGLVAELGGPDLPGVGFSIGMERLLLECVAQGVALPDAPRRTLFLLAFPETKPVAIRLLVALRDLGVDVDIDLMDRSFKAAMKYANKKGHRALIVIGEREVAEGHALIKWMDNAETTDVPLVAEAIAQALAVGPTASDSAAALTKG